MCHINVLVKTNKKDYVEELIAATSSSYLINRDGNGIFFSDDDSIIKNTNKIRLLPFREKISRSFFVITHQRLATSGMNEKFLHPFADRRWILVHNGILNRSDERSDTAIFFMEFQKNYTNDVKDALEKAAEKCNGGSFSIFLYDKQERCGYYFKSSSTDINVVRLIDESLFFSTSKNNLTFFDVKKEIEIVSKKLYRIRILNEKPVIEMLGKIKLPETYYKYYNWEVGGRNYNNNLRSSYNDVSDYRWKDQVASWEKEYGKTEG